MFADDVTLFIRGKNIKTNETIMQKTLDKLEQFTSLTGFKFSKTKTQVIVFSRNKTAEQRVHLNIGETTIDIVEKIKILK